MNPHALVGKALTATIHLSGSVETVIIAVVLVGFVMYLGLRITRQ